jgi:hypothetical protein
MVPPISFHLINACLPDVSNSVRSVKRLPLKTSCPVVRPRASAEGATELKNAARLFDEAGRYGVEYALLEIARGDVEVSS